MKVLWVISCITVLVGCSSEPPTSPSYASSSGTPPGRTPEAPADDVALVDEQDGTTAIDAGAVDPPSPSPPAPSPEPQPKPDPKPAPVGSSCQPGDTKEIEGEVTPFTKTACGDLSTSTDEDFFALAVPTARNLALRISAQGDAVARLETPNGNVIVVSNGGTASVGSASGTAMIRVRSKSGTTQAYRLVAE